jgi:hypothetical protein
MRDRFPRRGGAPRVGEEDPWLRQDRGQLRGHSCLGQGRQAPTDPGLRAYRRRPETMQKRFGGTLAGLVPGSRQVFTNVFASLGRRTGISNKCTAKSVAGLPTQIVNDKGRSDQQTPCLLRKGDGMPCRHGSFPQNCRDRAMLATASFIIRYLSWQAQDGFGGVGPIGRF